MGTRVVVFLVVCLRMGRFSSPRNGTRDLLLPRWLNGLNCFLVGFHTKNDEETKKFICFFD